MWALATLSVLLPLLAKTAMAVPVWGQCGGIGYTGPTDCDPGNTCVRLNDWYYQCQPGGSAPTTSTTSTTTQGPGPTTSTSTTTGPVPTGTPPPVGYNQVMNFGTNPTNAGMYSYVPSGLGAAPGLVVALHWCTGSAQAYYTATRWRQYADQKRNFIVIYGDSPRSGKCWDVSSPQTLQHDGGSDSLAIANVVRYALNNWGVDPSKVFVTGSSSGAMMANVLAGAYPDLFKVAVSVSGVPYGCFGTTDGSMWNSQCANGQRIMSGQQWGNMVRSAYPGYSGSRPNMMIIHGTADTTLAYPNFGEMVKQWTNVHGISETPTQTRSNDPQSGWTHTSYGTGQLQAYSVAGGTHDVASGQMHEDVQIAYFGI